jgi:hypothetical protein
MLRNWIALKVAVGMLLPAAMVAQYGVQAPMHEAEPEAQELL